MALIGYTYEKTRSQFGKQCVFEYTHGVAQECILPIPEHSLDYVIRTRWQRDVQSTTQIAAHEAQTENKTIKNTGMLHQEGGWPREINIKDNEALHRYRRRVEKDENWSTSMKNLLTSTEHYIHQNNAMNLYQYYFDDMIPTALVKQYDIRVKNSYQDPQPSMRPIRCLSWSPNSSNRLAGVYSFPESEDRFDDVNPYSYVWDIEDSNKALIALKPPSPLMAIEFNPRDPSLLISGLMSGQVCCWDIRMSDEPVQISHPFFSHRRPASQALWISSKANTEFFSSSINGTVLWWDTRFLRKPTDSLLMDLDDPKRADSLKAIGVTALNFEPTISSRFLAGMENGAIVNVNRRGTNNAEKLALRFNCCTGPVVAIDRNPIVAKSFLTIGDWTAKIWSDDTREGCLLSLCDKKADLSGGCWSRSRCSVFYTINTEGLVEAYDLLSSVRTPLVSIRVCSDSLTAISSHEDGELLAVGSHTGNIYLLECSEGLNVFSKEDRALLNAYLESCSRYGKLIDNRLKEILLNDPERDMLPRPSRGSKGRRKKSSGSRDRKREKRSTVEKEKPEIQRKSKSKRSRGKNIFQDDPELIAAEEKYFSTIEEVSSMYEPLDEDYMESALELLRKRVVTAPKEEESDSDKRDTKKDRKSIRSKSSRRFRSQARMRGRRKRRTESLSEGELSLETDAESVRSKSTKTRRAKTLKSCPMVVCKPEICCMDMKDVKKPKKSKKRFDSRDLTEKLRLSLMQERVYRSLIKTFDEIPRHSVAFKKKLLKLKDAPPNVLQAELKEAKKVVSAWQEKAIARELSTYAVQKKMEKKVEDKEEATEKQEDEKHVSDAKKNHVPSVRHRSMRRRARKSRKIKLTSEDVQKQEKEEQKELWRLVKQKAKEEDAKVERVTYPRISAAFPRRSSEDVQNLQKT